MAPLYVVEGQGGTALEAKKARRGCRRVYQSQHNICPLKGRPSLARRPMETLEKSGAGISGGCDWVTAEGRPAMPSQEEDPR